MNFRFKKCEICHKSRSKKCIAYYRKSIVTAKSRRWRGRDKLSRTEIAAVDENADEESLIVRQPPNSNVRNVYDMRTGERKLTGSYPMSVSKNNL